MAFAALRTAFDYVDQPPTVPAAVIIGTPPVDGDDEVNLVLPSWSPPAGSTRVGVAGVTLVIEYLDSRGAGSRRRVTLHEVEPAGEGRALLHAYCHERRAPRCFRLDRVRSVIDADGVVIEEVREFFAGVLGLRHSASAVVSPGLDHLKTVEADAVRLAVMLGQADGRLCDDELGAIVSWVAGRCDGIVTEADLAVYGRYLGTLRLTGPMLDAAIASLEKSPGERKEAAVELFYAVIGADGSEHPREIALLDEIEQQLGEDDE